MHISAAASQLATHQLAATAAAVIAHVVLIEIRSAGHHNHGGGASTGAATASPLHDGLEGPLMTVAEAIDLGHGPCRRTGEKP